MIKQITLYRLYYIRVYDIIDITNNWVILNNPLLPPTILGHLGVEDNTSYTFCMCNPPFFSSNLESWAMLEEPKKKRRKLVEGDSDQVG